MHVHKTIYGTQKRLQNFKHTKPLEESTPASFHARIYTHVSSSSRRVSQQASQLTAKLRLFAWNGR